MKKAFFWFKKHNLNGLWAFMQEKSLSTMAPLSGGLACLELVASSVDRFQLLKKVHSEVSYPIIYNYFVTFFCWDLLCHPLIVPCSKFLNNIFFVGSYTSLVILILPCPVIPETSYLFVLSYVPCSYTVVSVVSFLHYSC